MRRHVLRNGLQPTVSVIGVQVGYVLGSLVAIEKIFNYPGSRVSRSSTPRPKDPPVLVAGVLVVAIVYMLATLSADLVLAWMNPRARLEGGVMSATEPLTTAVQARCSPTSQDRPSAARPAASAGGCCAGVRGSSSASSCSSSGSCARSVATR